MQLLFIVLLCGTSTSSTHWDPAHQHSKPPLPQLAHPSNSAAYHESSSAPAKLRNCTSAQEMNVLILSCSPGRALSMADATEDFGTAEDRNGSPPPDSETPRAQALETPPSPFSAPPETVQPAPPLAADSVDQVEPETIMPETSIAASTGTALSHAGSGENLSSETESFEGLELPEVDFDEAGSTDSSMQALADSVLSEIFSPEAEQVRLVDMLTVRPRYMKWIDCTIMCFTFQTGISFNGAYTSTA